jgi:imidazolonepropionase-like amidohydrolase
MMFSPRQQEVFMAQRVLCLLVLVLSFSLLSAAETEPLALTGGTILTVTHGTIENGTLLIRDGKIEALGADVELPEGVKTIDVSGRFVMPGIIDAHSHIALDGGINEATSPVTPQIDMATAVVPDDLAIYRALAGGVTATKLMHGSANVIGGINITVKLNRADSVEGMRIRGARPQLKMALGENPKRLYGGKNKTPATRPAEFALIRQSFLDAQDYAQKWERYEKKRKDDEDARPPKRDLKLDTLAKVLAGEIAIDCHAYVAHEILTLIRIAEEFDLPLVAISHGLEAYKVRDQIASKGISLLTHTDWWGYKWEAYDSIPYGPAMLVRAGINTTIISDSGDVMRRLNREVAKLQSYGDLSDDEALAMITINAARALEIDKRTGSLETGKDADIAVFENHPLGGRAKCVLTFVDGELLFDAENPDESMVR